MRLHFKTWMVCSHCHNFKAFCGLFFSPDISTLHVECEGLKYSFQMAVD